MAAGLTRALTRVVASIGKSGISGTLAGMSEEVAGYPLDIVSTRMKIHREAAKQGTFSVMKNIVKHEGFKGLFSGLASPLAGSALLNAVLFGGYERSLAHFQKTFFKSEHGHPMTALPLPYYFYAGAIGGLASTIVTCPVDVVKNKMQVMGLGHGSSAASNSVKQLTTFDVFKSTMRTGGLRGIYLGMVPTLLRDVPGYGVYFFVYESLKRQFGISEHDNEGSENGSSHGGANIATVILSGGLAGMVYHASVHPIDVCKSIIQIQETDDKGRPKQFKNIFQCANAIYKSHGLKGFAGGIGPTVLRSFPASGIGFAVYELVIKLLP